VQKRAKPALYKNGEKHYKAITLLKNEKRRQDIIPRKSANCVGFMGIAGGIIVQNPWCYGTGYAIQLHNQVIRRMR
jgi:hypothetical protein